MAELKKPRPSHQTVKVLMTRTFTMRREAILTSQFLTVLEEYPMLKRSSYVSKFPFVVYLLICAVAYCRLGWSLSLLFNVQN